MKARLRPLISPTTTSPCTALEALPLSAFRLL
jgi:hypothetical protein